ncbi:MAG: hypothetical protein HYV09_03430 [Deltaproteobacteria bacterium]|nr:hypothetical protein [Deltaproteobacteria bacterium]
MSDANENTAPAMVRVRVKSKTGDVYVRAGRHWRADRWMRVEVPLDVALRLHDDPWLDVRDLPEDAPVDVDPAAPEATTLERHLADAHEKVAALEERLRTVEAAHELELEQFREAHAREISAVTSAATRHGQKRQTSEQ